MLSQLVSSRNAAYTLITDLASYMDDMTCNTHGHCVNCFSRHCRTPGCPLVPCERGCGAVAHQCKMEDHEMVCTSKVVPCINAVNGCQTSLPRHKMSAHLKHCSASVVVCKFAWKRVDRLKVISQVTGDDENDSDDRGSSKIKGEKFVEEFFYNNIIANIELLQKEMPGVERSKGLSLMTQPYSPHLNAHFYGNDPDKLGRELKKFYHKKAQAKVVSISSTMCCYYIAVDQCRQQLHVVLRCNETVKRDQFENHYKTQHDIIHSELGGWLVYHCPFYEYGCNFSISRLLPAPNETNLIYSKYLQKFAITQDSLVPEVQSSEMVQGWYAARLQQQRELAAYGYSDVPVDPISQLPSELLHIIIRYLDSGSLFCLSMTSRLLRDACQDAVRGNMVQLVWQRKNGKWRNSQVNELMVYTQCTT